MDIVKIIKDTRGRLSLSMLELSKYWGIPLPTLIKWHQGDRVPNSSAIRLIGILGMIEVMAPVCHAVLINECREKCNG